MRISLTDDQINNMLPARRRYKHFDGKDLYIEVRPHGRKVWILRYKRNGSESTKTLGDYSEKFGVAEARIRKDEVLKVLASGHDLCPSGELG